MEGNGLNHHGNNISVQQNGYMGVQDRVENEDFRDWMVVDR